MKMQAVRQRAKDAEVSIPSRVSKGELIRMIQRQEGNQDCFGASWRHTCPWVECCWRDDCLNGSHH